MGPSFGIPSGEVPQGVAGFGGYDQRKVYRLKDGSVKKPRFIRSRCPRQSEAGSQSGAVSPPWRIFCCLLYDIDRKLAYSIAEQLKVQASLPLEPRSSASRSDPWVISTGDRESRSCFSTWLSVLEISGHNHTVPSLKYDGQRCFHVSDEGSMGLHGNCMCRCLSLL